MKLTMILMGLASATALAGLDGARGLDGAGTRPSFPGSITAAPAAPTGGNGQAGDLSARRQQIAAAIEGWKRQLAQKEAEYKASIEKHRSGRQSGKITSGSAKDSIENRRRQQEMDRLRQLIVYWSAQYASL